MHSNASQDAEHIVKNPEAFPHPSALHSMAWAILKEQRGQTVRQSRLSAMQRDIRNAKSTVAA